MSNAPRARRSRLSAATHAGYSNSPVGWIGALSLHALLIAGMLFTFAHKLDIAMESSPVVPVELVTLSAKTNIAPTVTVKPRIEPKELEPPPPPAPPEPAMTTPQEAEIAPPDISVEKPKPAAKTPPKEEKKKAEDEFAALLDKAAKPERVPPNAKIASRAIKGFGDQTAMTADLQTLLQSMIYPCWNIPAAAPHPEQLIVNMTIFLNPDGSVAQPPQLAAQSGDPFQRAAAEAAKRAIYVCAPYKLPVDRYAQWREFTVTFDPRIAAGKQ